MTAEARPRRVTICGIVTTLIWITLQWIFFLHRMRINDASGNPWKFAHNFDLIPIYRSNLHAKEFKYWYNWIKQYGPWTATPNTNSHGLTLLHLDTHALRDTIYDEIHDCSPGQLFQYDLMVVEVLEQTENLIDNFVDLNKISNLTEFMSTVGYFSTVVWVYPDHWTNFSTTIAYDVHLPLYRQYVHHQTYYVTPLGGLQHRYSMLKTDPFPSSASNEDMYHFWEQQLFHEKIDLLEHVPDPAKSLQIDIMAIPISALLTEPHLLDHAHRVLLEMDLDFFACQSVAENIMERFGWNQTMMDRLNDALSHHHYRPQHIPPEKHQEALIAMMHLFNSNQHYVLDGDQPINTEHPGDSRGTTKVFAPKIKEVLKLFAEHDALDLLDLRETLHLLYRLQLEVGGKHVEPMDRFMAVHRHVDGILDESGQNEIGELSDLKGDSMPYRDRNVIQRQRWHCDQAELLGVDHECDKVNELPDWTATIDVDGNIESMNQPPSNTDTISADMLSNLELIRHRLVESSNPSISKDEEEIFQNIGDIGKTEDGTEREDVPKRDHKAIAHLGVLLLDQLEGSDDEHKISHHVIESYLNSTKQNLRTVDFLNLTQFVTNQVAKIWNPDHEWFHDKIKNQRQRIKEERNVWRHRRHKTYPELLKLHDIDPSYRFHGWQDIVEQHKHESWTKSYIEDDDKEDTDGSGIKLEPEPINLSPPNETDLKLTAHDIDHVIRWDGLDLVQQHFLRNADHRAMKRFITNLNEKQSMLLQWLLFCYHHSDNCDDGHHPFQLVEGDQLSTYIFGEHFQWRDMLRVPSFVESLDPKRKELLQLEFISLGTTQKWLRTPDEERDHLPSRAEIKDTINLLASFLSMESISLISGGVELSRAHVPRHQIRWIECLLMHRLQKTLHRNESHSKMKFMRYQVYLHGDVDPERLNEYGSSFKNIPSCVRKIVSPYI